MELRSVVGHQVLCVVLVNSWPALKLKGMVENVALKEWLEYDSLFKKFDDQVLKQEREVVAVLEFHAVLDDHVQGADLVVFQRDFNRSHDVHYPVNVVVHFVEQRVKSAVLRFIDVLQQLSHYSTIHTENLDQVCLIEFHKRFEEEGSIWLKLDEIDDFSRGI